MRNSFIDTLLGRDDRTPEEKKEDQHTWDIWKKQNDLEIEIKYHEGRPGDRYSQQRAFEARLELMEIRKKEGHY